MHFETDGEWVMTVAKPRDKNTGEKVNQSSIPDFKTRVGASKSPTMNHSPTLYGDHLGVTLQAPGIVEENDQFLANAIMYNRDSRLRDRTPSPSHDQMRSSMNGGLLIKQEHTMVPDQHLMMRDPSEPMHHIIKRELHSEYEELDQEAHLDGMAEDLTTSAQNHGDSNMLDA